MPELTAGEIPNILKSLGWSPRTLDKRTWRCTQKTPAGDVRIVVRHAGTWLYLVVMPFLDPEAIKPWGLGKYPPRFLGRILAVNHNLVLVKFALDDEGDITLRVELPTESLQRNEVETTALLLLQTTEQYRGPIRDALIAAGEAAAHTPLESQVGRPTAAPDNDFGQPATASEAEPEPETLPPPAALEERSPEEPKKLTEKVMEEPAENSPEKPTEKPAEVPAEVPAEAPTEVPAEVPTEVPAEKPTEVPAEKPAEVPAEVPAEKPEGMSAKDPEEKSEGKPADALLAESPKAD